MALEYGLAISALFPRRADRIGPGECADHLDWAVLDPHLRPGHTNRVLLDLMVALGGRAGRHFVCAGGKPDPNVFARPRRTQSGHHAGVDFVSARDGFAHGIHAALGGDVLAPASRV